MRNPPNTPESPAEEYARLLGKLHELITQGEGDSAEADAIRDEMDGPWYALTEQERERLNGLSEDLSAGAEGTAS